MNDARRETVAVAMLVVAASAFAGIGAVGATAAEFGTSDAGVTDDAAPSVQHGPTAPALQDDSPPAGGESSLGEADTTFLGTSEGDRAGTTVTAVGDVNGDGHPDVAVGAPNADAGGDDSGAAYLFYGPVERGDLDLADADATFAGATARDRAGFDVAGGDVNGDGVADLLVGAPVHNSSAGTTGAVHVVFGGDSLSGTASLADADATLIGAAPGDEAGYAVDAAATGGDGGAAVVVGAPGNDSTGDDAGAVYVLDDVSAGESSLADSGTVVGGEEAGDRAGFSVAGAGDADGDGAPDVLVGAPDADAGENDSGAAYAVTDAIDAGSLDLSNVGIRLDGDGEGDRAGFAVAGTGDLNDDGFDDLLVGAPRSDASGNDSGAAYVVYGSDGLDNRSLADADAALAGASAGDLAGWSVAGVGSPGTETDAAPADATCDGVADLLVGAPAADANRNATLGAAYLVGGDLAEATDLSDAAATFVGERDGDFAGSAVAGAGDATGDGVADLLVGAPRNDASGNDSGAAYLLASDCPPDRTAETTTAETTKTTTAETTAETKTTSATTTTATATTATTATATAAEPPTPTRTTESETTASSTESPETTRPSVDVTQTQVQVAFECARVTIAADEYDAVVLTFADGTQRSFEGPFTGQRTFAGEDGDVIRSLEISVGGVRIPVDNPAYEECAGR